MSFWTELVDAAVLGTARAAVPPPAPALADVTAPDVTAPDPTAEASARLLRLAAVASRARRAGFVPAENDWPARDPAPPDPRPAVSPAARQRIDDLLADGRPDLVIEWLTLLAGSGRRPPEAQVPGLLASATENQPVRDALRPVLGPRAAWVAAANPAWEWATTAPAPSSWTTASHRARRDTLDQLRRTDPAAGRELVASTWSGDSARDRTAFIAGLATGLHADDEPLLDRALADRRGEVRQAAATLLARLPSSAFSRRAASRAAAAVRVEVGRRRGGCGGSSPRRLEASDPAASPRLLVTPPPEATAEMLADELYATPPKGTGLAAWLLRQVVAAAPAAWWTEHTGLPPAGLLAAAATDKWATALASGWADAAIRDAHGPWLTALLARFGPQEGHAVTAPPEALIEALPPAERDAWLAAHPHSPLFAAVELVPWPWSAALSAAARDLIVTVARADPSRADPSRPDPSRPAPGQAAPGRPARRDTQWPNTPQQARRLLRVAAVRLDPPVLPDLPPAEVHPLMTAAWAEMMNTLSVRAAMRRELAEEPPP